MPAKGRCSRWQVAGIFSRKTAANTVAFLNLVRAAMPFPIQRIQTDRGQEFFAYLVRKWNRVGGGLLVAASSLESEG